MRKFLLTAVTLLTVSLPMAAQDDNTERLWYDKPATIWLEALPVGNGRLGGMVYGGTQSDEIQLNEDSFWSGGPHNNNSTTSANNLERVRNLIFSGKEQNAEDIINQQFIKGPHGMKYLTLGSLILTHTGIKADQVTNYRRELDLQTALAKVSFDSDGHHYTRTVFASMPDSVIIKTDPNLLRQILINLVKNAIEAGAKTMGISCERGPEGKVMFYISNDGEMIPPEARSSIFIPFFTTKRKGNGIGLSLSRRLLTIQGGMMSLLDNPLTTFHTTFLLEFPA